MLNSKETVVIVNENDTRLFDIRQKKGTRRQYVDAAVGAKNVDFHINTLFPNPNKEEGLSHYHEFRENVYYVLQGKINVKTEHGRYTVEEGQAAYIPAGVVHAVWNAGDTEVKIIEVYAPCVDNDFIEV